MSSGSGEQIVKGLVDTASAGTAIGTIFGYLPEIAALFTILWTVARLYETALVQKLLPNKWRMEKWKTKDEEKTE